MKKPHASLHWHCSACDGILVEMTGQHDGERYDHVCETCGYWYDTNANTGLGEYVPGPDDYDGMWDDETA